MYNLTDSAAVRSLLTKHGFNFSKGLGQNFIIDPEICPDMVEMSGINREYGVIEIGPGIGVITREAAEIAGFSEAMTYSFESPKVFDRLLLPADSPLREAITIANPLGEDYSIMRTISLNGMLTSLGTNYSHRNKAVRLFEAANIYIPKALPLTELPDERMQITFGMYGCGDFFNMKGVLEDVFTRCGVKNRRTYDPTEKKPFFHPGRQADVFVGDQKVAYLGEVHPLVAQDYGIKTRAYIAVIDLPALMPFVTFDKKYAGLAKFPAVNRDLSMVVPKEVSAGQIETVFLQRGGKILESIELFDIYEMLLTMAQVWQSEFTEFQQQYPKSAKIKSKAKWEGKYIDLCLKCRKANKRNLDKDDCLIVFNTLMKL